MKNKIWNIALIIMLVSAFLFVLFFSIYNFYNTFFRVETDTSKFDTLVSVLERDKIEILAKIENKDKEINLIYEQIRLKDKEIQNKNKEISKLKFLLDEKVDSIGNLDNKHTYEFLSKWLSKNN